MNLLFPANEQENIYIFFSIDKQAVVWYTKSTREK